MKRQVIIEVLHEQFYSRDDCYHAFLHQGDAGHRRTIAIANDVRPDGYFAMTTCLAVLKTQLEMLGNEVKVVIKEMPDPNFDNGDEAAEAYEQEQDYKGEM